MSIYNFLFLYNHNFDSIVLRTQFLVVQKFNQIYDKEYFIQSQTYLPS
jgi:hypothetical protein